MDRSTSLAGASKLLAADSSRSAAKINGRARLYPSQAGSQPPIQTNSGARTRATTDISLIKIFRLGPAVSLNGSPTVSPTTAAL